MVMGASARKHAGLKYLLIKKNLKFLYKDDEKILMQTLGIQ